MNVLCNMYACIFYSQSVFSVNPAHREKHVVIRCMTCGALKRFHARAGYKLWSENPENIIKDSTSSSKCKLYQLHIQACYL